MAIYHLSIKIGGRHGTKSSVAAAAYRAGTRLKDERTGQVYDYRRKKEVAYSEIILPENAPSFFCDRGKLWNSVEGVEKQDNAQLYREFEIALPKELSREHKLEAAREFFTNRAAEGMIVDWSFHDKKGNPHVHGIAPTRGVKKDGSWAQKRKQVYALDSKGERIPVIDPRTSQQKIGARGRKMWKRETVESNNWNDRNKAKEWRAEWTSICNRYLALEKSEARVDDRSYQEQGLDRLPTVHEGIASRKIEERGDKSELAEQNRQIGFVNSLIAQVKKVGRDLLRSFEELRSRIRKEIQRADELSGRRQNFESGHIHGAGDERAAGFTRGIGEKLESAGASLSAAGGRLQQERRKDPGTRGQAVHHDEKTGQGKAAPGEVWGDPGESLKL